MRCVSVGSIANVASNRARSVPRRHGQQHANAVEREQLPAAPGGLHLALDGLHDRVRDFERLAAARRNHARRGAIHGARQPRFELPGLGQDVHACPRSRAV